MLTNVCGIVEQLQIGHHLMVEKGLLSLYSPHASLVSSLSIQSCLFSVCRMRAALSSPSSIARLHHFLSISSPDECHSPPPILLSFLFTLCHFCTTLSLLLNLQSRQAALSAPLCLSLNNLLWAIYRCTLVCAVMSRHWENDWLSM